MPTATEEDLEYGSIDYYRELDYFVHFGGNWIIASECWIDRLIEWNCDFVSKQDEKFIILNSKSKEGRIVLELKNVDITKENPYLYKVIYED